MIIFGHNSTTLKTNDFSGHACTNCGREETVIQFTSKYFHIFWIPIFPYKKIATIGCKSCQHINKANEVSQEVRDFVRKAKSTVKHRWYSYIGLILISTLVIVSVVMAGVDDVQNEALRENPQINDIYLLSTSYENMSGYEYQRVERISRDSIWTSKSSLFYTKYPLRMDADDTFLETIEGMKISEFKNLKNVKDVYRE